jgi:maltooligosyltrehalose synthase
VRATYRLQLGPDLGFATDPWRISEDLGGEAAVRELAGAGLDLILDIVPNRMADATELFIGPAGEGPLTAL